jgi:hypothetical protein
MRRAWNYPERVKGQGEGESGQRAQFEVVLVVAPAGGRHVRRARQKLCTEGFRDVIAFGDKPYQRQRHEVAAR